MNYLTEMYLKCINSDCITRLKSEKGQTLVEYALLLLLIAIVVIAMLTGVGQKSCEAFSKVNSALQ